MWSDYGKAFVCWMESILEESVLYFTEQWVFKLPLHKLQTKIIVMLWRQKNQVILKGN